MINKLKLSLENSATEFDAILVHTEDREYKQNNPKLANINEGLYELLNDSAEPG